MRPITDKEIQQVVNSSCGATTVDHLKLPIKYKDFKNAGVKRKADKTTGKPFLLLPFNVKECDSCTELPY